MSEESLTMDSLEQTHALFGDLDCNVNTIQKAFGVTIFSRGSDVKISGADEKAVDSAKRCLESLSRMFHKGDPINEQNVRYVISLVNEGSEREADTISSDCVCVSYAGKPIRPKTLGQKKYCEMIRKNTITFGVGPAGTGKTYLAVALAVSAFKAHEVQRIILTRPAVEAGIPPRRPPEQGGPLPASALRRAVRDVRAGGFRKAPGAWSYRGGAACLHARPYSRRQLHNP